MKTIEYLGTGPNPIDVSAVGIVNKGDIVEAEDHIADQLVAQGLFKFVTASKAPVKPPQPE